MAADDEIVLIKVQYDTDEAQKAVVDLTDEIFELTEETKKLRQQQKKVKGGTEKEIEVRKNLNRQIEANKDAIKKTRKERTNSIRVINKEKSSFQKLGATLKSAVTSYLGIAAAITAVVKGITSIVKSNVEFEQSLASLSAITGAIGKDLDFYAQSAKEISKITLQSATDIIKAFELVGSARPELLKNKEALAEVTKQAIILSEATGGKLGLIESAEAVTGVMNQMRQSSSEAARIINILAAGSKEGSANVQFLAEAFEKTGTSANLMGLSVEEVTGALEANAPFFAKASLLGNSFDKVLLKLKENQIGFASGTFNLNDAIDELRQKYENGTSAADIFGVEHAKLGELLVQNQGEFNTYTEAVTGTTTALEQQAIQNDTLGNNWKKLMNGIRNSFISSNISGLLNAAVKDMAKSFDNLTKKIEHVKLGWQRLKGELTKAEYKQALDDLVNSVSDVNEVTEKGIILTENETKATNASTAAIKNKAKEAEKLAKKAEKEEIARRDRKLEAEINQDIIETERREKAEEEDLIRRNEKLEFEINQDIAEAERVAALEEKKNEIRKAAEERRRDLIGAILSEIGSLSNDFANLLVARNNKRLDDELRSEETKRDKALAAAGDDAEKRNKINEDFEAKKLKLQKKAAKDNQKIQIGNAIVQGALVVLNALGTKPFVPLGLIAAIGAGLATGIQIATIKQQSFGKGGQVKMAARGAKFGTFDGASHSGGGVDLFTGSGQHVANVEGKENFYVVNKNASDYINSLSDINQRIGGGVPLSRKSGFMQDGGQADVDVNQPNINDITANVLRNLPPIVVQTIDIKTGLENRDEVINVGVV